MPAISTLIAVAGLAVAAGGAAISYSAAKSQSQANQSAIAAQQEAERQRQLQMNLDAARRKREIIRQSIAARSQALAVTTAQGAAGAGGSSLAGAYGSIAGRTGANWLGVDQNQQIGNAIFSAHQDQLGAYQRAAAAGSMVALGQGLGSLGGAMVNNAGTFGKVGIWAGNQVGSYLAPQGGYTGWARA